MNVFERVDERKIGEILVEDFSVPKHYVEEVLERTEGRRFGETAIAMGIIPEEKVYGALSKQFTACGEPLGYASYVEAKKRFNFSLYEREEINSAFGGEKDYVRTCAKHGTFPALVEIDSEREEVVLYVAVKEIEEDNINYAAHLLRYMEKFNSEEAEKRYGKEYVKEFVHGKKDGKIPIGRVKFVLVSPNTYDRFVVLYKGPNENEIKELKKRADAKTYLQTLLTYAVVNEASDIHLDPSLNSSYRISMRMLSFRKTLDFVDADFASSIISLIRQNANIPSGEHYKPHDGVLSGKELLADFELPLERAIPTKFDFSSNSFRVSTYPVVPSPDQDPEAISESVVLRVLSTESGFATPESLGLSKRTVEELGFASERNQGIILIVGPTGSGKTTTLYSTLSKMDAIRKKIISFEDPVEIRNLYWTQGEKRDADVEKASFTFSDAARSILRQDPDVILVGEIRDEETASFALKASNTGHLVFTTLHANSAASAIPRLRDLGVRNMDIVSSLLCVISQRLIRKLCPRCKIKDTIVTEEEKAKLRRINVSAEGVERSDRVGKGCVLCGYTGYVGREVIDEILPVTDEVKKDILADLADFELAAKHMKGKSIVSTGLEKVAEGAVSIDEIIRVV